MVSEKGLYEVVWPRGRRVVEDLSYAKRLESLEGKTLCELWDGVFHGDKIFITLEKELTKRYTGIKFVSHEEFGCIHGAEGARTVAALPVKLREYKCDAVICGVG
ncbi:hypothetical protein ACFLSK_01055 [Chloroflexota bacterium]